MKARNVIDYAYIIIGSAITALGIVLFLNPAMLAPGGVSGIATILFHTLDIDLSLTIFVLTLPLFFIGLKLFGKQYGVKTLLGSILLSVFTMMWAYSIIQRTSQHGCQRFMEVSSQASEWDW